MTQKQKHTHRQGISRREFLKIGAIGAGAVAIPGLIYLAWLEEQNNIKSLSQFPTSSPSSTIEVPTDTATSTPAPSDTPSPTDTPTQTPEPASTSTPIPVDFYVDSTNGDDANDGKTPQTALATLSRLMELLQPGQAAGLACGSHWREQLDLPGNACQVAAYGSGARPILDASNVMSSWSKTGGQTYVYQITCTPEWSGSSKVYINVWEDGDFLIRAASLAACNSTAGSYYPSGSSGEITLYVHATDDGDPASNGSTYEYSHRKYGLTCYAYSGCRISGIETRKSLHNDGSLVAGQFSILVDCAAKYGNLHNIYVRTGSTLTGCIAQDAYCGTTTLSLFVYNENTPASEGITFINCQALCSSLNTYATGFFGHRNTSGSFGTVTYQGCTAQNCGVAFNGIHAASIVALDSVIIDCTYGFRTADASPWTITRATVTGACSQVIQTTVATTVVASYLDVDVVCNNSLLIYFAVASTVTVTDSNFAGVSFAGSSRIFYVSHVDAVVSAARNVYHTGFAHVYAFLVIASFTSDLNSFDDNTETFNINGTTYATVAAYQAATSQDSHSTIGGA